MRGGFRGRGRGRGGGPGDARAMQALRDPPKAPGVLYPPFGDPAYLAPPTEFEDLVLQYSMQLEDTLRDGIGIPYAPPPPVRSQEELAAEKNASGPGKKGKGRDKGKKANGSGSGSGNGHGNGDVDMEDLGGHGYGNGKNGNETGFEGFEAGPSGGAEAHYAEGGIGPDQEAFHGWRIPDARRFVGVEIDDLNDRPSKWGVASSSTLRAAGASDKLDKDLLCLDPAYFPPGLWDAHFVDDERSKRAAGKRKRDDMRDDRDLDLPELDNEDDRDSNASSREDPDQFGDEEEMDHEDYDANYFDNGEGDDDEGGGGEEGGGDDF